MKNPIEQIDFEQLKEQKAILLNVIMDWGEADDEPQREDAEKLTGLLHFIDSVQDYAVNALGKEEGEVFDLTDEA